MGTVHERIIDSFPGIIPAALGNIIGGSLFCGGYYWYLHLFREAPVLVDGKDYEDSMHKLSLEEKGSSHGRSEV